MLELKYYVYRHKFNSKSIERFNVFDHVRFYEDVTKALKKSSTKAELAHQLRKDLFYYYGLKCEWEVVITAWPPHINMEELDRLNEERAKAAREYYKDPHILHINPDIYTKIDVCDQVMLNWNVFLDYVWSQKR